MNFPWEQPARPLDVQPNGTDLWIPVLFMRPCVAAGWEVISMGGHTYDSDDSMLRTVD
jgi:hypothetical protein